MNLFWAFGLPTTLIAAILITLLWSRKLGFFSRKARDLEEVHLDFEELRIEELEDLVCVEADNYINREWRLGWRLRRRAVVGRLKIVRGWLRQIAVNASLCVEVGRFNIRKIEDATNMPLMDRNHLAVRILERGIMCQFIAAVCLVKMYWVQFCMMLSPFYLPDLAGRFEVRGHSLAVWYGHMVEDVLELASEDEKDWLFENTQFMLTGLIEMPDLGEA